MWKPQQQCSVTHCSCRGLLPFLSPESVAAHPVLPVGVCQSTMIEIFTFVGARQAPLCQMCALCTPKVVSAEWQSRRKGQG